MSAWIISEEHLNVILFFAGANNPAKHEGAYVPIDQNETGQDNNWAHVGITNASEIGQILWEQNHKSVNYHYGEREATPEYIYLHPARNYSLVEAAKALASYEYQSCDSPDWEQSMSYRIVHRIQSYYLSQLAGYEDATTWSVEDPHNAGSLA